jgi:hypothetical protein
MATLRCLYAEMLRNKRVTMTVASVRTAPTLLYCNGKESSAWDVIFTEKDKAGATLYIQIPKPNSEGKSTSLLRQYIMVTGGEPDESHAGAKLTLHPVKSRKATTGQALRIALPDDAGGNQEAK